MKLLKIDEQGYFIEDVILDKIPTILEIQVVDGEEVEVEVNDPSYVHTPCQGGLYKPKWNGTEWIEGLSQNEIDSIKNKPKPKTELEQLQETVDMLLIDSLGGM